MVKRIIKLILIGPAIIVTAMSLPILGIVWVVTGDDDLFYPGNSIMSKLIEW